MLKKSWLILLALPLIIAACFFSNDQTDHRQDSNPSIVFNAQDSGIWVNGEGSIKVVPDLAFLTLGIEANAETIAKAQTLVATAMTRLLETLQQSGIANDDIQTEDFSIQQRTRWSESQQKEVLVGFQVTNRIHVKIRLQTSTQKERDHSKIGQVIDRATSAGGDLVRVQDIRFALETPEPYRNQAMAQAFSNAKIKAERLAALAQLPLGQPTYLSEETIDPSNRLYMGTAQAAKIVTPISPGTLEIKVQLRVRFNLGN